MWRGIRKFIWRFMVIFSFIVNLVLVIVLVVLLLLIFDIKNNIAQPIVNGLHSSFVGLDSATIDWTIPVRDSIQVVDTIFVDDSIRLETVIPLETDTIVVLTQPVSLSVTADITLAGGDRLSNAQVFLALPQGLQLPVHLNLDVPVNIDVPVQLDVPVNLDVPVELDVRAIIPINQTQLHDPIENLRLTLEPIARILYNLPDNHGEVIPFVGQMLSDNPPDLLAPTDPYFSQPWPGYSQTAGVGYEALMPDNYPPQNVERTGIVPIGGIPALDQALRPELYANGMTPAEINAQAAQNAPYAPQTFDGSMGQTIVEAEAQEAQSQSGNGTGEQPDETNLPPDQTGGNGTQSDSVPPTTTGSDQQPPTEAPDEDLGIISPGG